MDGILVVDKPQGPTSHDVVAAVRQALNIKKVGHTGTLDPMATGVLPLVLGRATKLARYTTGADKTYRAVVRLGVTTRTLDADGEVLETRPVESSLEQVEAALETFRGQIQQLPPMFSAKKIDGQKLYRLARKGLEVARDKKTVTVRRLDRISYTAPDLQFDVCCSAGTYVRVLAQDIGELLGCGGHLLSLCRLQAGPFHIDEAIALRSLIEAPDAARQRVLPLSRALGALPHVALPSEVARRIALGYQLNVADLRTLDLPQFAIDEALALALDDGKVVAIARAQLSREDVSLARRDRLGFKTERVLLHAAP
jgi:tRNA pseudouridine55 synthase